MSLLTRDYDYELPKELIARWPLSRREESRMMVLHRAEQRVEHRLFADFPAFIQPADLVVLNDTKVVPARVFANEGTVELLFLERAETGAWKCMVKPGRKMKAGAVVRVGERTGQVARVLETGERVIEFNGELDLGAIGEMPLPPYLERTAESADTARYQTVYARAEGAIAAPTAGLHFTAEMLACLPHTFVTLHVGAGTSKPVQSERINDHVMHTERFSISRDAAEAINAASRVLAIGTTTLRVLESCVDEQGRVAAREGVTGIFIHPPFEFRVVNALLTNFHLPKSTLLMLVSAFAGREFVLSAYREAIRERYRFYSYGDCMLIV